MTGQRLALGCMRLSVAERDEDRDEDRGIATIRAALDAGMTVFDTARSYGRDDSELGHNERLLARALREHGATGPASVRIVTKGGMKRPDGRWEADGRASALRADCEASLEALGGLPIDLYLLHAPDPRVSWSTSVRALARLLEAGLVRSIGLSNVSRRQLDEACAVAAITAVQVALGPFAETALRGGVVARCIELGIEVLAHSPLGGPPRAAKLSREPVLSGIAARHGVTAQRVALAAIADLHASVLPIAGARRPETVRACAAALTLDDEDRAALERRYGWRAILAPPPPAPTSVSASASNREVTLVMGIQGAGKSSTVSQWVDRGSVRVNRDERGGSMRDLHCAMDNLLAAGERRIVADNTYTTRASRQPAIETARRHDARIVGIWLDTPLAEAQRNVILRMLAVHGRLLEPEDMDRARDPSAIGPGVLNRTLRGVEPPAPDEGFTSLEVVPFVRRAQPGRDRIARFVTIDAAERGARGPVDDHTLALVFGWRPGIGEDERARMQEAFGMPVRCCPHAGGPPRCWCRPPLPGILLEFAERHGVDLARSTVVGTKPTDATLARAVGAEYALA
jgi:aryl-alcohol dehydrogenase-like predicted oxidoreductase